MADFYDALKLDITIRIIFAMAKDKQPFTWLEGEGLQSILKGIKPG